MIFHVYTTQEPGYSDGGDTYIRSFETLPDATVFADKLATDRTIRRAYVISGDTCGSRSRPVTIVYRTRS